LLRYSTAPSHFAAHLPFQPTQRTNPPSYPTPIAFAPFAQL
jgi:hypothetical protein